MHSFFFHFFKKNLFSICLSFLFVSCTVYTKTHFNSLTTTSNCNHEAPYSYTENEMPKPLYMLQLDSAILKRFTLPSLNAANAIGILPKLEELFQLKMQQKSNYTTEQQLNILSLEQQIQQRINIASLEVASTASEMDCEEERADQVGNYLMGKIDDAKTKLTVGTIAFDALGAISAGILLINGHSGNATEFIGIGTGLAEATLGEFILTKNKKVKFYHPRNALRDIWNGPTVSTIFPSSVWYFLNYKLPGKNEISLREQLVNKWVSFGQIAVKKPQQKEKVYALYFGNGGTYTAEQLTNRANMYDQLESYINLMKQDLRMLNVELEKLGK
jgi:hypothetical protein